MIVDTLEELKLNGKIGKGSEAKQIAEVLWAGIHGVVSLKLIYPAFPATKTATLVKSMIKTLLNGILSK